MSRLRRLAADAVYAAALRVRSIIAALAALLVGGWLAGVTHAQLAGEPASVWPTSLPVGLATSLASFLVAIVGSWAALRYGLRDALSSSHEARRRADAAHRRVAEVNSDVIKIRLELRSVAATMSEFQSSMRSDVAELRSALLEERRALDNSQRQIMEQLNALLREGCGRAGSCG